MAKIIAAIDPAVAAFLSATPAGQRATLEAIRHAILAADTRIGEGIKWNAPSFRTADWFATTNLRGKGANTVRLILHAGAKRRATTVLRAKTADPSGILEWLGPDRTMIAFADAVDVAAKTKKLNAIVRAWIAEL